MTPLLRLSFLGAALAAALAGCGAPEVRGPAPEDPQSLLLNQIRAQPGAGQIDRVWDLCSKMNDARPWLTLGYLYYVEGNAQAALACYGFALHYDPGNRTVRRWFLQGGREPFNGQITFRWRESPDSDGYFFYLRLWEDAPWVRLNGSPSRQPQITVSGLETGKTYECSVEGVQRWGENDIRPGLRSEPDRRKAYPGATREDPRMSAVWKGKGSVRIRWKRSQELWVRGYHVSIVMPGSAKPTLLTKGGPISTDRYDIDELPQGARYKILISQVGANNEEEVYAETDVEIPLK